MIRAAGSYDSTTVALSAQQVIIYFFFSIYSML